MFEGDLATLSTADLLDSAAENRAVSLRADARTLECAQVYADRHHPDACPVRPGRHASGGRERAVVLGGDGCPEIAEFAIAEFGVILGISPQVAADYIGQALALRHRFPFTWARVRAGDATPWKARRIAADCLKLSEEAARYVDQRIAPLIDSITPYRLDKIVKAAKKHADPELARSEADEKARERGVFVGRCDEHGTKTVYIKAASGAVIRFDATIAGIADALKVIGDTRSAQTRRAVAVGIIADPRYTEELLTQARNHRLHHPTATSTGPDTDQCAATTRNPIQGSRLDSQRSDPAEPNPDPDLEPELGPELGPGPGPGRDRDRDCGGDAVGDRRAGRAVGSGDGSGDDALLEDQWNLWAEPGPDDEADRDAPHPSSDHLPDPLDAPSADAIEPFDPSHYPDPDDGDALDIAAQRALNTRLAQIKHDAHTNPTTHGGTGRPGGRVRPGTTDIYVHLTDHTLATGTGVLRAEGIGPLIADQLTELVGHGPYTVKPVIDLNHAISVDAYEIPDHIREQTKLTHPVELFPYGTRETNHSIDLDHIQPYNPLGPPRQTGTTNLAPLGRFGHRVKTHAHGWKVRRLDHKTLEWTTPHGFVFHVNPTGTHRVHPREAPDSS